MVSDPPTDLERQLSVAGSTDRLNTLVDRQGYILTLIRTVEYKPGRDIPRGAAETSGAAKPEVRHTIKNGGPKAAAIHTITVVV